MMLYNADKELVSKTGLFVVGSLSPSSVYHLHACQLTRVAIFLQIITEVKTKLIVELGTMDAVFTLDSGGTIILQLQFFLSDEDRKRIQEMVRCFFYDLCYFHESLKNYFSWKVQFKLKYTVYVFLLFLFIQRNSVMKRKQQELLGNGDEFYFQGNLL